MGFPVGYSELLLPKLVLRFLFFLAFLRRVITTAFDAVGLGDLLESDAPCPEQPPYIPRHGTAAGRQSPELCSMLIQEILPVVRLEELLAEEEQIGRRPVADACAVCLYEIEPWEEVRRLSNCRHVFHRCCLDRWVQHDQWICPLCRTPLIPVEMQEAFNLRMRAAGGFPDSDTADFPSPFSFPTFSPALL